MAKMRHCTNDTQYNVMLSLTSFTILSVIMLTVVMLSKTECRYAEFVIFCFAECLKAECRYCVQYDTGINKV